MSELHYACKVCYSEEAPALPILCSNCFSRIKSGYTRVRTTSSSHWLPRNLRLCRTCAPTYSDAQVVASAILGSKRMVAYKAVSTVVAMPLAAVILPAIFIVGIPVYAARKTVQAARNKCKT